MAQKDRIRTLILYASYTDRLSYYNDWLDAFEESDIYCCSKFNICNKKENPGIIQDSYDLIILLHSTNGDTVDYLRPIVPYLECRSAKVVIFVGNEVNLPGSPISDKRAIFQQIQPEYIATQLPLESGKYLWGDIATNRVIELPHALNPRVFKPYISNTKRPIDIGVRAVKYIPHLGDNDRNHLHDYFDRLSYSTDLNINISTDRLDRDGWCDFLNQCKATVSSEAGSWFLEKDDATVNAIREWVAGQHGKTGLVVANDSVIRRFGHKLPWSIKAFIRKFMKYGPVRHEALINESLDFNEIYDLFFKDKTKPSIYGKCISSRHFDAVGTKTCQILLSGRYNNILKQDVDYIELQPDYSNIDDVIRRYRDDAERLRIIENAYHCCIESHTYDHRVDKLASILLSS